MEQCNLFGGVDPPAIAIEESAIRLGVSTATIRNWIKTKYLESAGKGRVTLESLEQFKLGKTPSTPRSSISCEAEGIRFKRFSDSFSCNPKSILNLYCDDEDAITLQHLLSVPYTTLKNQASWGLGIVTGNNKKFVKSSPQSGHIPVYKGADILKGKLKDATSFIPSDMRLYQQVAPLTMYEAKEKLIYKFISSKLCFFYDDKQRAVLNSANILIPDATFPVSTKMLGDILSSDFMNWVFSSIFNTHKILRGDLESLPIHNQFLKGATDFDEARYLQQLNIEKTVNGTYRIKR